MCTCTLIYVPSCIHVHVPSCIHTCTYIHSLFHWSIVYTYIGANDKILKVSLSYSQVIYPWTGWLSVTLSVVNEGSGFNGEDTGQISLTMLTLTVSY